MRKRDEAARLGVVLYGGVEPIAVGGTIGGASMAARRSVGDRGSHDRARRRSVAVAGGSLATAKPNPEENVGADGPHIVPDRNGQPLRWSSLLAGRRRRPERKSLAVLWVSGIAGVRWQYGRVHCSQPCDHLPCVRSQADPCGRSRRPERGLPGVNPAALGSPSADVATPDRTGGS